MVNYCCVSGCGRNSRHNSHLKYYSLPKEKHRQIQWLKAACREDLLDKDLDKLTVSSYRFCSRHFAPSCMKNRNLVSDAVPNLCLPGSNSEDDSDVEPAAHKDIVCNGCGNSIQGFRYKCVTCSDYDLCQKCEMVETHSQHYMLRMPKPMKYNHTGNLVKKWKKLFNVAHVTADDDSITSDEITLGSSSSESSDDEPINKYVKNYDSGIDMPDEIKTSIRKEVARVLTLNDSDDNKKKSSKRRQADSISVAPKKQKLEVVLLDCDMSPGDNCMPEVAFADVNNMKDLSMPEVKTEVAPPLPVEFVE